MDRTNNQFKLLNIPQKMIVQTLTNDSFELSSTFIKRSGLNALHSACMKSNLQIVELLLSYGANVNAVDIRFSTPLAHAVNASSLDIVIRLVTHGASPCIGNTYGFTPIHSAAVKGFENKRILSLLLFVAECNNKGKYLRTDTGFAGGETNPGGSNKLLSDVRTWAKVRGMEAVFEEATSDAAVQDSSYFLCRFHLQDVIIPAFLSCDHKTDSTTVLPLAKIESIKGDDNIEVIHSSKEEDLPLAVLDGFLCSSTRFGISHRNEILRRSLSFLDPGHDFYLYLPI